MNKKVRKQYRKYQFLKVLFYIINYLVLYLPVAIFTFVNRAKYFYHYEGIKVGVGAIIAIVLIVVFTKREVKKIKSVWVYLIIFVLSYFLGSIIDDMLYISLFLLIGKGLSMIVEPFLNYYKKLCETYLTSGHNANIFKETLNEEGGE